MLYMQISRVIRRLVKLVRQIDVMREKRHMRRFQNDCLPAPLQAEPKAVKDASRKTSL